MLVEQCRGGTVRGAQDVSVEARRVDAMVDPPGKARHCTLMLLAAAALADCAPDDVQQRALARYTFLYADALLDWARRWRNQLKREPASRGQVRAAKVELDRLAVALDAAGGVRDYLAAKRQSVEGFRADDIEATTLLWEAVNPQNVQSIGRAAISVYDTLNDASAAGESIVAQLGLSPAHRAAVRAALPARDPAYWHLAADTAADLRAFTLPAAQGGNLGRRIAQINDVANHLDVLLRIAPIVQDALPYDWLVRSAMVVELSGLLDLTVGPPPSFKHNVMYSLLDLCRQGRPQEAADELERLRGSIGNEGWDYVRWMRNTIGAHVDDDLTMFHIHRHLIELDYQGVIRLAEHVLNWLDFVGATQLDLKMLLLGETRIRSWPTDPNARAFGAPDPAAVPGGLAHLFRTINSPYMSATASTMGSAVLAGVLAGRRPRPRDPVTLPGLPNRLEHMLRARRASIALD
jgi:hypothetical protein